MKTFTFFLLLFISLSGISQDGQLDLTFTPPSDFNYSIEVITQQTDGKILIGGHFDDFQYLKRLNMDGSLDTSFSSPAIFFASMTSIVIQPDGKILTGGVGPKDLVRLNADGSMDATFDTGEGIPFGGITKIILQNDGKIIIGGDFDEFSGTIISGMVRLNVDGSIDPSFNLSLPTGTEIRDCDVQSDGKLIIVGFNSGQAIFKRFNIDNLEDTSFNNGDISSGGGIYGIEIVEDDKIMITGPFEMYDGVSRKQLARLNSDGTLDTSFDSYNLENGSYTIFDAKVLDNGQYLINGYFNFYDELPSKYIAKINNDGTIDETFNMGGGADVFINSTYIQQDGRILIGGDFTSFNGTNINHMARLSNGTLGVNGHEDNNFITIYPNPFNDNLSFHFGNKPLNLTSVNIYNVSGQLVQEFSLSENITINYSKLQSGIYFVKINNGKQLFTTKIIKQ